MDILLYKGIYLYILLYMQNEDSNDINTLIRSILLEIYRDNGDTLTTATTSSSDDPIFSYTRNTYAPSLSSTMSAGGTHDTREAAPAAPTTPVTGTTTELGASIHTNNWNTMMIRQQNLIREVLYDYNNSYSEYTRNYTQIIQVLREMNQILLLNMENNSTQSPAPTPTPPSNVNPIGTSTRRPRPTQSSTGRHTSSINRVGGRNNITSSSGSGTSGGSSTYRALNPFQTLLSNYIFPIRIRYTDLSDNELLPLTSSQIENATQIITYNRLMNETRCPISWEEFRIDERITRIRHCGHIFKTAGLTNWLRSNSQCPVCRYDLRDYVVSRTVASEGREEYMEVDEDEGEDYMLDNSVD